MVGGGGGGGRGAKAKVHSTFWVVGGERFNDWGGRGYDDFVPKEVTKTAPSGDRTT